MKFSKLDLLTLLISLFLFSSCKDSSEIGLDIDPANAINGTLLDTVSVTSRTILDEPANTYNIARYPLGQMRDPIFGTTTASLAMAVNTSGTTSFGTNTVIDSVVLVLPYSTSTAYRAKEFYGDSTATYNITVSQLTAPVATQTSWLSNKVYAAGTQLGTFSGKIKPNTPVSVISIIIGAADTAVVKAPHMRIKLNSALIKSEIADLDSLTLSSNPRFNDSFKGLKVSATTTGANGGMMFLDFSTDSSSVEVYYRKQNATTTTAIDTVLTKFPVKSATNPIAATVTHDYTNTPVATQLATPGEYQATYLQAMSGVRNKLNFPYLKDLKSKIGAKMVVSKAELVIDSSDPADSIPFKLPPRLALYTVDAANKRVQIADNNAYTSSNTSGDIRTANSGIAFGGIYDYTKKSYSFTVTNYVQDIIDGKIVNYGLYLAPVSALTTASVTSDYLYPVANTAGRVVIGSFNNTNSRKIRLNIYYVKSSN